MLAVVLLASGGSSATRRAPGQPAAAQGRTSARAGWRRAGGRNVPLSSRSTAKPTEIRRLIALGKPIYCARPAATRSR